MNPPHNSSEELGSKVQRAGQALEQIRGDATVAGVRVVVDSENRLLSVSTDDEGRILAAYRAAVADKDIRAEVVLAELRDDPRIVAISSFAAANSHRANTAAVNADRGQFDETTYEELDSDSAWKDSGW
jgi:hypothetical protein